MYPFAFGYCTILDVQTLFPNAELYSNLDDDRFNQVIADASIEMDGYLSRFYATPVTDPSGFALTYLRTACKYWAAGLVHKHFYVASDPPNKSQGQAWAQQAMAMLQRVVPDRDKDGKQPYPQVRFPSAPLSLTSELPDIPEGAAASFNSDNDQDLNLDQGPYFQRTDRVPWRGGII